ncbi:nuclear poly(A) polymerase 3 [Senna tora]|uniref:Nuclear poly(A) polymerase 3 n=1 Tax=Senna tora TaxID=362788 RepID=A0A834TGC7_9FABA|nr:nuclear poly(A) polymerase 3 [Senna tora]
MGSWNHRLPKRQISITSATVLTFGSYDIRVHSQNVALMLMVEEGLVPSPGWEMTRKHVIQKLEIDCFIMDEEGFMELSTSKTPNFYYFGHRIYI